MDADIQCYLHGLQLVSISCIKKGGNRVAHILAFYARNISDELYWLEDSPPPILKSFVVYI